MGGLEKLQKNVYVILYEWSLIYITFMDDTIFVSSKEIWTDFFSKAKSIVMPINVGNILEFSGPDLNRIIFG